MTPVDLDAIRARYERMPKAFVLPLDAAETREVLRIAVDVPVLLALVAELRAERDEARQYADSCTCGAWMNPAGLARWAERPGPVEAFAKGRQWAIDALRERGFNGAADHLANHADNGG